MPELIPTALFPTFVFAKDNPEAASINPQLARAGYLLRELDPEGIILSNRGGWQSQDDLTTRSEFAPLIDFIEKTMLDVKEFLDIEDTVTFYVGACWLNINGKRDHNLRHIHGNTFFSGVYYVKVPENSGVIQFFDPNPVRVCFHVPYKEMGPKNSFAHSFDPVEGQLLVFPGYVAHEVTMNQSEHDRISISFNVHAK